MPTATLTPTATPTTDGWRSFAPKGRGFTIDFPNDPRLRWDSDGRIWVTEHAGVTYSVGYEDVSGLSLFGSDDLAVVAKRGATDNGIQSPSTSPLTVDGYGAVEVVGIDAEGWLVVARMVAAGDRIFMLSASEPDVVTRSADATRFLDSFHVRLGEIPNVAPSPWA